MLFLLLKDHFIFTSSLFLSTASWQVLRTRLYCAAAADNSNSLHIHEKRVGALDQSLPLMPSLIHLLRGVQQINIRVQHLCITIRSTSVAAEPQQTKELDRIKSNNKICWAAIVSQREAGSREAAAADAELRMPY